MEKVGCSSGMILDFRIPNTNKDERKTQIDIAIHNMVTYCDYDKEITTIFRKDFTGFTCVYK